MTKDILKFQSFLEKNVFQSPLQQFSELTRGGMSENFFAQTADYAVVIKLLPAEQKDRAQRLCQILQTVSAIPDFSTPGLVSIHSRPYFEYGASIGLVMPFVPGRKLKNSEITPVYAQKVIAQYNKFSDHDFTSADFVGSFIRAEEIHQENHERISTLIQKDSGYFKRKTLKFLQEINDQIYAEIPHLEKPFSVIHGDASLNNMLLNPDGSITFLDFEFIRYGYTVEDAVFLIFSILTPRLFLSRRLLKMMAQEAQKAYHFTFEEWTFAVNRYFLTLLQRRLRGNKLLKSPRKDWLFLRIMQRRQKVLQELRRLF